MQKSKTFILHIIILILRSLIWSFNFILLILLYKYLKLGSTSNLLIYIQLKAALFFKCHAHNIADFWSVMGIFGFHKDLVFDLVIKTMLHVQNLSFRNLDVRYLIYIRRINFWSNNKHNALFDLHMKFFLQSVNLFNLFVASDSFSLKLVSLN
jgi:hypothetical protein